MDLNNTINTLHTEKNSFQSQVKSLNTTYQDYMKTHSRSNSEYDSLNTEHQNYKNETESLKHPQLHEVNVWWDDYHPWFVSPYVHIEGSIFNSGSYPANNV